MIVLFSEGNGVVPRELEKKNIQSQEYPGVSRML